LQRDRLALDALGNGTRFRPLTDAAPASAGQTGVLRPGILRLRALLVQRSAAWAIIAAGLLLCAPAVVTGLILDDNFHAVALGSANGDGHTKRAPWDAYTFAGSKTQIHQMVEDSVYPWWSDPQARLSFFRPLTSLTLWLDHQVWPKSPVLMHMQSLFWYGLLLFVIARVYRRFSARAFSLGFAGLALLLYAVDDAHAMSVGWLANRSALTALLFGFAALLSHDDWRSSGRTRHLVASVSLMGVALACGESALQALGYFAAYALFLDPAPKRARWKSLVPYVALVMVWRTTYHLLGFGAARTALYIDPVHDPMGFAQAVVTRLPVLIAAQIGGLSADLSDVLKYTAPEITWIVLPLALFTVSVAAWLFYPLWSTRRDVRFWLVGTLLSTLPVCAVAPADRLLIATGLGGSALIAILLLSALDRARETRSRGRRFWAGTLAVIHLVVAPLLLPVQAYALSFLDDYIASAERSIPDRADLADKTVMLLNPPTDELGIFMSHHRRLRGGVMPEHIRWVANADNDLLLTRVDAHTLKVKPGQGFLPPGSLWTLRSSQMQSKIGDRVDLSGTRYTVTDVTADGRPAEVLVELDRSLDSHDIVWMRWDRAGFVPFQLPQIGGSMLVPAVDTRTVPAPKNNQH
jgi:hypothetical protein